MLPLQRTVSTSLHTLHTLEASTSSYISSYICAISLNLSEQQKATVNDLSKKLDRLHYTMCDIKVVATAQHTNSLCPRACYTFQFFLFHPHTFSLDFIRFAATKCTTNFIFLFRANSKLLLHSNGEYMQQH